MSWNFQFVQQYGFQSSNLLEDLGHCKNDLKTRKVLPWMNQSLCAYFDSVELLPTNFYFLFPTPQFLIWAPQLELWIYYLYRKDNNCYWTYIPCFISSAVSEQCSCLQCSVFTKDPLHGLPPFLSVTVILREVILTPPPQVALHGVQGSQLPHSQLTSLNWLNIFLSIWKLRKPLILVYYNINKFQIGIKIRLSNLIYLPSIYSPNFEINSVAPSLILSKMTMFCSENDHNS